MWVIRYPPMFGRITHFVVKPYGLSDVIAIITITDDSKLVPVSDPIHLFLSFGETSQL